MGGVIPLSFSAPAILVMPGMDPTQLGQASGLSPANAEMATNNANSDSSHRQIDLGLHIGMGVFCIFHQH